MSGTTLLVADGSRARFFAVDPISSRGVLRFEERADLVEPERGLTGRQTFSEAKSGRKQSPGGGPAHAMDDHRTRHRLEVEDRFAKRIATEAAAVAKREGRDYLVVVAEPHLLGLLRPRLDAALPASVRRAEVDEDLSWHALSHIRRVLERRGVLEPPPPPQKRDNGRPRRHRAAPPR